MTTHTDWKAKASQGWKEVEKLAVEVAVNPELFVGGDEVLASRLSQATKQLFDLGRYYEDGKTRQHGGPLPELELEGFESAQLWEQLALHHTPLLRHLRRQTYDLVKRADKRPQSFFPFIKSEPAPEEQEDDIQEDESQDEDEEESGTHAGSADGDDDAAEMDEDAHSDRQNGDDEDDEDDEDEEEEEEVDDDDEQPGESESKIGVEDRFFDMDDMERFIEQAEQEAERERDSDEEGAERDENDFDDEEDMDEEEEDEEGEMEMEMMGKLGGKAKEEALGGGIKYDQFFDAPEAKNRKKIDDKIKELEDKIVGSKPWQLRGEIGNRKRPLNSLLEEHLEFESAIKQAPVITEEVTVALEDIIKRRIIEGSFDDVVRKEESEIQPRKAAPELDFQKSQKSLAELYEEEYLKSVEKASASTTNRPVEEKRTKQQEEILRRFANLAYKLDALTNFHYTPRPVLPDITVKENVAAIRMEEIIPVGISDASLLAPQEVFSPDQKESALPASDSKSKKKRMRKKHGKARPAGDGLPKGQNIKRSLNTAEGGAMTSTKLFKQLTQETQQQTAAKGRSARPTTKSKPDAPSRAKDTGFKL